MSTTETVRAWSTTAATNATADAAIASSDTQSPDTVDNNIRSIMVAVKKQENDTGGALAAGGTANALTVTTGQVLESGQLVAGLRILLRATATNTASNPTFAPDGLTARNIKRADGSLLAIGSIRSGMYLDLVYNTGSTEWRCLNIDPVPAAFRAHKGAVDQAIATTAVTQLTFGTETFDQGSYYATNAWTPPAGTVLVHVQATVSLVTIGGSVSLQIQSDGVAIATHTIYTGSVANSSLQVSYIGLVDGTNALTAVIASSDSSYTVDGTATLTYFEGMAL